MTEEQDAVLVVGAAGFLGGAIVRSLANRAIPVRGLIRRDDQAERIRHEGGSPVRGDILDPSTLERALRGCRAVVHVAANPSDAGAGEGRERAVRVDGARNLVRAAHRAGIRRLVLGSGYWVYRDAEGPLDEDAEVAPIGEAAINFAAEGEAQRAARSPGLEVVIARPGMVYGPGAWFIPIVDALRRGEYRLIDGGLNPWSFVSLEDTGEAFATLLERGEPESVYTVVDDRPAPWGEFARHVADRLRVPAPTSLSLAEATALYGEIIARQLSARRAMHAPRLRRLGWRPRWGEYAAGVDRLLERLGARAPGTPGEQPFVDG